MLIRSQSRMDLVDFTGKIVEIEYIKEGEYKIFSAEKYYTELGVYSTKEKAIKVLDMIQESHADFETAKNASTGVTTAVYTGSYDTPESVAGGIKVLKGYVEMMRESVVFQMPEDSEVEI